MADLYIDDLGDGDFEWTIDGLNSSFNTENYIKAGITTKNFTNGASSISEIKDSTSAPSSGTRTYTSGTFYLSSAGAYTFYGFTQATNGYYYNAGIYIVDYNPSTRPNNFVGFYFDTGDDITDLTAYEWNGFCDKVNEFREYKGLSLYSFTEVYRDDDILASYYNQARSAIRGISGYGTYIPQVEIGDDITPYLFTTIKNELNSIE